MVPLEYELEAAGQKAVMTVYKDPQPAGCLVALLESADTSAVLHRGCNLSYRLGLLAMQSRGLPVPTRCRHPRTFRDGLMAGRRALVSQVEVQPLVSERRGCKFVRSHPRHVQLNASLILQPSTTILSRPRQTFRRLTWRTQ